MFWSFGKMSKIVIANWNNVEELLGGQETFFNMLSKIFNAKKVSYVTAENVLRYNLLSDPFKIVYRGYIIEKYLNNFETLFKPDLIIKNSGIGGFIKLKTPQVVVFQDPFYTLLKEMVNRGIFTSNCEHYSACINLMRESSKGASTVAVSNFMEKEMERCGVVCHKIIEEGINHDKFKPLNKEELRKKYNIPLDKKVGIAVTKFIPQKGWNILADLINKFQDVHWIVVLTTAVEIKPKLKNVSLFGRVDPELMPELYNCADFYISTSLVESFNLSACEAASCNIPIITYKTGWAWDWFDSKLGYRVDKWDSESFAKAVEKIRDSDLKEFSPRESLIKKGFTLERMKKDWKEFVEKTLNSSNTY